MPRMTLDGRIDKLCARLGFDDAPGAKEFANRLGRNVEQKAWLAAIWIASDGRLGGNIDQWFSIAAELSTMLHVDRDLEPGELATLMSQGQRAWEIGLRLIAR